MENETTPQGRRMGPKQLARLRSRIDPCVAGTADRFPILSWGEVAPLLADRDHWEAEARRYRARCPVTREDVESSSVSVEQARAWCRIHRPGDDEAFENAEIWQLREDAIPFVIHMAASATGRAPLDILEEMRALRFTAALQKNC